MRVALATFGTAGVRGIDFLIARGLRPHQILVLLDQGRPRDVAAPYAHSLALETCTAPVGTDRHGTGEDLLARLRDFAPDLLLSLYFPRRFPAAVLACAPRRVNLHPALLPTYRGAFSAPWMILNGERCAGFTYHEMIAQLDAGPILIQETVPLYPDDTAWALYHRLVLHGTTALPRLFELLELGYVGRPQAGEPTYFPRRVPHAGFVDPAWPRDRIDRFIRALHFPPYPPARVRLRDGSARPLTSLSQFDRLVAEGLIREPAGASA